MSVSALINHSLLRQVEGPTGQPRFGMLETIREFALERLESSDEAIETHRRHAAWYVRRAEQLGHMKRRALLGNPEDVVELTTEYGNLWAALTWLTQVGDSAAALRLSAALGGFWNLRGHLNDGRSWLERTLAEDDGTQPAVRASALRWLSMLAGSRGGSGVGHGIAGRGGGQRSIVWRGGPDRRGYRVPRLCRTPRTPESAQGDRAG